MSAPAQPQSVPLTVEQWLDAIQVDDGISQDVKSGRKPLHVTQTSYQSGSHLRQTEFLHLRSIWNIHGPGVDEFDKLLRDNTVNSYQGYVSDDNLKLAGKICENPTEYLNRYYSELRGGGHGLTPDPKCGVWATVRLWQALVSWHSKTPASSSARAASDEKSDAKIVKKGFFPSTSSDTAALSARFANAQLSTPTRPARAPPVHGTPYAVSYGMASDLDKNPKSVDEVYVNMALILMLQAVVSESVQELGSLNWLPPRLSLKLRAHRPDPAENRREELLEAQPEQ